MVDRNMATVAHLGENDHEGLDFFIPKEVT